ncbi:MAG: hypothetical protein Q9219_000305 [cf. Caloplaca sp. 3 TL-2023]
MGSISESPFFARARRAGRPIVKDLPKFDLEAYIANYRGKTRFDRLLLIGTTSTLLAPEALRYALAEAKQGKDVGRYDAIMTAIREIIPEDPCAVQDLSWREKVDAQVKAETDRLEAELKGYKNNLIKESIRVFDLVLNQRFG